MNVSPPQKSLSIFHVLPKLSLNHIISISSATNDPHHLLLHKLLGLVLPYVPFTLLQFTSHTARVKLNARASVFVISQSIQPSSPQPLSGPTPGPQSGTILSLTVTLGPFGSLSHTISSCPIFANAQLVPDRCSLLATGQSS